MKTISLFLVFLALCCNQAYSQITLNSADLPHANDTFRLSVAQITPGIDYSTTGPGQNWDFSQLIPASQRVDTFIDESATNSIFAIVFIDIAFNSNRANQATPGRAFNLGATISLSDVYNFYYNSSASYKQVGLGATVNGVPLPITLSPHDIIYKLPLHYADLDSASSGYSVDLTSTIGIYYKVNKTRRNEVDGWGTLTTAFGTFDVLRVHSTVVERDSVYLDTLGVGFNFPAITTHEYKWLGASQGVPLLQINTTANGTVSEIVYRDSIRSTTGIAGINNVKVALEVYPNPASKNATVSYELLKPSSVQLDVISADGKRVAGLESQLLNAGKHDYKIDFSEQKIASGRYFVRLLVDGKSYIRPLLVTAFR